MTDDDLDLVPTNSLLSAIHRRCDISAVVGVSNRTGDKDELLASFKGSNLALSSLLFITAETVVCRFATEVNIACGRSIGMSSTPKQKSGSDAGKNSPRKYFRGK